MQKWLKLFFLCFICNIGISSAEKYRAEIFRTMYDPASTARGFSGVADSFSIQSAFLNPACINSPRSGLYFSHFELYKGFISMENVFVKFNSGNPDYSTGIYVSYLHSDPLEITQLRDSALGIIEGNIEVTGKYIYKFYFVSGTIGRKISEKASFGVNIKFFRERFYTYYENGTGIDIGYLIALKDINFGITLRDAIFSFFTGKSSETASPSLNFGITKFTQNFSWNLESELFSDGPYPGALLNAGKLSLEVKMGAEYRPTENLALRAGFYRGYFNGGVGLRLRQFFVDYSISPNPELYTTHKIGAGICF